MSAPVFEGIAVPDQRYTARGTARPRYLATLGGLAVTLVLAAGAVVLWDRAVADESIYACPPDCGRPPHSVPVETLPRFVDPAGKYSVAYPPPNGTYEVTTGDDGVTARLVSGDGGVLRLFSLPGNGRDARQIVERILAMQFAGADIAYELPNATVGYEAGYGIVANFQPPGLAARNDRRLILVVAVKNDVALVAMAEGQFRRFSPDFGPGPPSAANAQIAIDMGKYVDSFEWNGGPPR